MKWLFNKDFWLGFGSVLDIFPADPKGVVCRSCHGEGGFMDDPTMTCPDCEMPGVQIQDREALKNDWKKIFSFDPYDYDKQKADQEMKDYYSGNMSKERRREFEWERQRRNRPI